MKLDETSLIRDIERCEAWGVDPSFLMKKPTVDDYWMDDPEDNWLYSGYWDLCILFHKGSGGFWK